MRPDDDTEPWYVARTGGAPGIDEAEEPVGVPQSAEPDVSGAGRRRRRIEIVGPPGAGKSTVFSALEGRGDVVDRRVVLYDALRRGSSDRLVRITARALPTSVGVPHAHELFYRSLDFSRSLFRSAARHPEVHRLAAAMSDGAVVAPDRRWRLHQKHATVHALEQFLDEHDRGVHPTLLGDESFTQALLIGIANSSMPDRGATIAAYCAVAPLPDVVVAVRAEVDTCVRRVEARQGGAWPVLMHSVDGPAFLARMDAVYDEVLEGVRQAGATVVEIPNDDERSGPPDVSSVPV